MLRWTLLVSAATAAFGAPCDCSSSWDFDGGAYSGCQNTPNSPGAPWCIVEDGPKCAYATNFTEPGTNKLVYTRYCGIFDTIAYDNKTVCTCAGNWTIADEPSCVDQQGCPSAACNGLAKTAAYTGVKSWCEVTGPCKTAPNNEKGPSYSVCVPEEKQFACDCMAKWEHNGAQYEGCTTSKHYPGTPWCKVDLTCKNSTLHADEKGLTYAMKYCIDGIGSAKCTCKADTCQQMPGEAVPTCEVFNAPCLTAPLPTGGNKAIIPCQHPPCECKPAWKWNTTDYKGCHGTPHVGTWFAHWCEVKETCHTGYNVTEPVTKEVRHIATCTPQECECDATWTYKGKQFNNCEGEAMLETGGKTWCVSSTCKTSQPLGGDAAVPWTPCVRPDACECLDNWVHYNVTYSGCATTWDSPGQPWCRVDPNCPDAIVDFWGAHKTCNGDVNPGKPCTCATACVTENVATPYCETTDFPCATAPTPTGNNAAFIKCGEAKTPAPQKPATTPAPGTPAANACACKADWAFEGHMYSGCQNTPKSPGAPWCIVEDGPNCVFATNFTEPGTNNLVYTRYCGIFDTIAYDNTTNCECKDTWSVAGDAGCTDQKGCPSEACNGLAKTAAYTGVKSWCEVKGACKTAPKNEKGPSYAVCVPEEKQFACDCMAKWEHNGAQYEGCTTSKHYPGTPWCKVDLTCKTAALHADEKGLTYAMKYCTGGLGSANCTCVPNTCQRMPGEAVPTCEVSNAPCLTAPLPTGGNKAIIPCQHPACECKPAWKWNNTDYKGCHGTPHVGTWFAHWCEVTDTCHTGYNVTEPVTKEVRHIATCTPQTCECDATWTYKGKQFNNCEGEAMFETGGKTWCVSSTCKTSQPLGGDAAVPWTPCVRPDACECLDNWVHYNVTYSGCATTWDSPGQPWCRVDPNCPDAIVDFWGAHKTCNGDVNPGKPCTCTTPCVTENVATPYCETTDFPCETAPTPTGHNAAFIKCVAAPPAPKSSGGLSTGVTILIIVGALLLIGGLVAAVVFKKNKSKNEQYQGGMNLYPEGKASDMEMDAGLVCFPSFTSHCHIHATTLQIQENDAPLLDNEHGETSPEMPAE